MVSLMKPIQKSILVGALTITIYLSVVVITTPALGPLDAINAAFQLNAIVIFGYEMLLGQAARAFEIWHDMEAPYNAMKKALLGGF